MAWKSAKDALFHPTHSPQGLFLQEEDRQRHAGHTSRILMSDRALRVGHSSRATPGQFWRAAKAQAFLLNRSAEGSPVAITAVIPR